ncbi:hypothetical protein K6106_10355 [Pseudomonas fluorescens]|nr:hypothetical protein K6106_10355 [Pseudomonas fluorescens]
MSYSDGVLNLDIFYEVEGFDLGEAKKVFVFQEPNIFLKRRSLVTVFSLA